MTSTFLGALAVEIALRLLAHKPVKRRIRVDLGDLVRPALRRAVRDARTTVIYTLSYTTLFRSITWSSRWTRRPCWAGWTCRRSRPPKSGSALVRSEEHTSELQSRVDLVCRLLLEKTKGFPSSR